MQQSIAAGTDAALFSSLGVSPFNERIHQPTTAISIEEQGRNLTYSNNNRQPEKPTSRAHKKDAGTKALDLASAKLLWRLARMRGSLAYP
jgi:hypothetical protein